jgi:type VI secretion system protein ImpK
MNTPQMPPSLFGSAPADRPGQHVDASSQPATVAASRLLDLMYDGFYLLFLLKAKHAPLDAEVFRERIKQFLTRFERGAGKLGASAEDIHACKYAFCATVDEAVLMSGFKVKESWQRLPLQVQFFGDQLAGEQFFQRLDGMRQEGLPRVQALEVYQMCLLLGFQGKYLIEGSEKLGYLTARLGEEIARMKGQSSGFAPHWAAPDRIRHQLRQHVPLWAIGSVFALMALLAFMGMRWQLSEQTQRTLGTHHHIVQLAPQSAHITITLP